MLGVSIPTALTFRWTSQAAAAESIPGKWSSAHRLGPGLRGSQVALPVGPEPGPVGPHQHDGALADPPVCCLPSLERLDVEPVVSIPRGLCAHIDDGRLADQPFERHPVYRLPPFGEMHRSIQVGTAVLRRADVVGGVVVAGRCLLG